jgi:hypothetical protein
MVINRRSLAMENRQFSAVVNLIFVDALYGSAVTRGSMMDGFKGFKVLLDSY